MAAWSGTGRWCVDGVGGDFVRLLWIAPVLCVVGVDLSLRVLWDLWDSVGRVVILLIGRVLRRRVILVGGKVGFRA